jgi:hypothetical protein
MIRIADAQSSRGSAGISMRTWLYLGSAVLVLSLMGLDDDHQASQFALDEPAGPHLNSEAARQATPQPSNASSETVTTASSRAVKIEAVGRMALR